MTKVTLAATQMACTWDTQANAKAAIELVRESAAQGANIILLQELFETPYFPADQKEELFSLARPVDHHPMLTQMSNLAAELGVVLPVSFFERANNAYFNALAIIDADGKNLGVYRKSHIPDGPGYQEKYYFNPGNTGFKVWKSRYGNVGAAICWDQWYPECARVMALQGADMLLYPTAIGNEPQYPNIDSKDQWQIVMQGHAAANMIPVVAANRIGVEQSDSCVITFYGSSFIAAPTGMLAAEASRDRSEVITAGFDLDKLRSARAANGLFRDRRTDLYDVLLTLDGSTQHSPGERR